MNFSKFLLPTKQMPMLCKEEGAGGEGQQEGQPPQAGPPSPGPRAGRSPPAPAPGPAQTHLVGVPGAASQAGPVADPGPAS